jgi:hypothetical protein
MQELTFQCNSCNVVKTQKFYHGKGIFCEKCNPKQKHFVSSEEQEVFDYITKDLNILNVKQSDRSLINPYEIDILLPDYNIAIEYCGLYWHSEGSANKDKNYHFNKMKLVNEKGYRLITIFSDEWKLKNSIVKSKLKNILRLSSQKYFARKLIVSEISQQESKTFLDTHHLQGHSTAKINLGLLDPLTHDLIALMTFSNGRKALNTKIVAGEYELVRFVTNGSSIAGGASKLLTHFIKQFHPTKITSYADLRWSEGNVYETIGFSKSTIPTIGYWYVDDYTKRLHRFNFTKKSLVQEGADPNKTEWETMQELGYDRIWDCGHQKYTITL